ncbi:HAMP domain-containing histidine kinase [Exilibacterium tricleocarpae]|uniref:histidine kinase n=1 Tax=Exilibacterium tricleocarpae TaxID=2591008 RepID=A0A545SZZ3_9GAMM|nr:HAMP domain-containing sensor histidine kinase [Exilibacterium tricleocarpae]TQV70538.1 HAMP domain-containing histidine kinase [Exilibacterium tricleocarpae]
MIQLCTHFKTKLMLAAGSLLTFIVVLACIFYYSTARYHYHLERTELANSVLSSYLAVSNHTYRKLNSMGEIVARGEVDDMEARDENQRSLRDALSKVRRNIAAEVAYVRNEKEDEELDHLVKIERLSEHIILGSDEIKQAIQMGDRERAQRELSMLRSDSVAGKFNDLIDQALAEEQRETAATQAEANRLGELIMITLPITTALILGVVMVLLTLVSRGVTHSIEALSEAAQAYTSGDLDYRIPSLPEREFFSLGRAFNKMAEELAARRGAAQQSRQSLEALIENRTKELQASNAQLENLDRSRRQLLADISHELRTPLTVIQGESEMALRGAPKSIDEYQDTLNRVRDQAVHTTRLVEDLLFVARAENGNARIEKKSVAIASLLRDVCMDFRSIAEKKRIEILDSYIDDKIVVYGDAGRLRQVFAILIDNAIRYSHTGGSISVDLSLAEDSVRLSVKDEGIGMTEEDARQAFHRFYRGDNAERHAQGTGLGLPVAKAIIEAHAGSIALLGKPGDGAEAVVKLPFENKLRSIA